MKLSITHGTWKRDVVPRGEDGEERDLRHERVDRVQLTGIQ